jgi:hypothetical protein
LSLDAQVSHPGPVWLDTLDPQTLTRKGFGAELQVAVERRREVLREVGIAPNDAERDAKLQDLGRRAVGRKVAEQTGQEFLARTPTPFRGRLQAGPQGASYFAVSDGTRFVLVPATPYARALHGKSVEVSLDARGRCLRLRARDLDRGR